LEGESQLHEDGCHLDLSVQEALDQFCQVKQILATTSERWSAVLLIECAITVCIAVEPVMYATLKPEADIGPSVLQLHLSLLSARRYALIQAQSRGDENFDSGEASVFFAATIPFIAILIVGLVGISRVNEGIAKVPVRMRHDCSWSVCVCVCVCVCVALDLFVALLGDFVDGPASALRFSVHSTDAAMWWSGSSDRGKSLQPRGDHDSEQCAGQAADFDGSLRCGRQTHTHTHSVSLSLSLSLSLPSPARPCTIVLTVGDGSQECR
jgi:hypothetical protein